MGFLRFKTALLPAIASAIGLHLEEVLLHLRSGPSFTSLGPSELSAYGVAFFSFPVRAHSIRTQQTLLEKIHRAPFLGS